MNKKGRIYVLGAVLLAAFAGFSLMSFRQALTPYVDYAEAQSTSSRMVQVAGALEKGSTSYVTARESLFFTLRDPESDATLRVRYQGLKPANFEEAISIVAIGHYDRGAREFEAEKLLVKCPSKYQGAEVKTYS